MKDRLQFLTKPLGIFNKLWFQMAIVVTLLILILFVILDLVVLSTGEKTFSTVLQTAPQVEVVPIGDDNFIITQKPAVTYKFNANKIDPLIQSFRERFSNSMLLVIFLALLGALGIGILSSKIVTNQFQHLANGMRNLRKSNYKVALEPTGTDEFDSLTEEFNSLVAELQKMDELRKDLISDTSHELKTPLTSILGQLQGIQDGVLVADSDRVASLIDQANRLSDLIERLQSYSRLRGNALKLKLEPVGIHDLVAKVSKDYKDKLATAKIKFTNKVKKDFKLKADRSLLEQIFNNLVENAYRYSKAKEIVVSNTDTEIIFTDNGVGIPAEHLPYIFERFYRVEKSRNRETGGLGLGLAIVKEIVEAHGWKIRVESTKGTKFVIETQPD
jgi:signal transduction histidine kinase